MKENLFLFFLFFMSCTSDKNYEDICKIKKGMSHKEVMSIMRNDTIRSMKNPNYANGIFIYFYKNNSFGVSDDFSIIFSEKDSTVIDIGYGD